MRQIEYTIRDKYNKTHILKFHLYDTTLCDKWLEMIKYYTTRPDTKISYNFNNYINADLPEITKQLKQCCIEINQEYNKPIPVYDTIDNPRLNELHEKFETWGEEYTNGDGMFTKSLEEKMNRLNELIHRCEDCIDDTHEYSWHPMGLLVDLYPLGKHTPISNPDRLLLDSDYRWGDLYLGYNTLGKDWIEVMLNNDLDVVERGMVKPQQRFAAEAWINFGPDMQPQHLAREFVNWWSKLPEHLRKKVPINNMNELNIGRFQLGEIIIDEEFLQYHNNESDWTSQWHPIKQQWNREVFSTFRIVEGIEVVEIPVVKTLRKI